jgi:hypothetical protein
MVEVEHPSPYVAKIGSGGSWLRFDGRGHAPKMSEARGPCKDGKALSTIIV